MRLAFLGTPPEAASTLRALHEAGHDIRIVLTQPDRRRGRGGEASPSPVKRAAGELGLTVVTPKRSIEALDDLRASGADIGVVVAFGQLLPVPVLEALPEGYVNVHFSLLPRWRGAAPVERAILAGDETTGVCLMRLEEGLDTGPVYACETVTIAPSETAGELRARLSDVGIRLLLDRLDDLPGVEPSPQEGRPSYAEKLSPDEFRLDWEEPAVQLVRVVRAGNPNPGAWTTAADRRLKVLRAHADDDATVGDAPPGTMLNDGRASVATGSGVLVLDEVQPEGKRAMSAIDWARGFRPGDERLGHGEAGGGSR